VCSPQDLVGMPRVSILSLRGINQLVSIEILCRSRRRNVEVGRARAFYYIRPKAQARGLGSGLSLTFSLM
jgi:hypothetical protein